jgi:hypothetical protein
MKTSGALTALILACVDEKHMLRHECKFVEPRSAEILTRLAGDRDQFVVDLQALAGSAQTLDGSWAELSREAWRDLWTAAAGRSRGDAIASCRRSRARTEATYDAALREAWPAETRSVIAAQRRRVCASAGDLIQLQF